MILWNTLLKTDCPLQPHSSLKSYTCLTLFSWVHHGYLTERTFAYLVVGFDFNLKGAVWSETLVTVDITWRLHIRHTQYHPCWCLQLLKCQNVAEAITILIFPGHGLYVILREENKLYSCCMQKEISTYICMKQNEYNSKYKVCKNTVHSLSMWWWAHPGHLLLRPDR